MAAARRILQASGPDGLTMVRLAAEAGLSRATIYRRVGGREAILERLATEDGFSHEPQRRRDMRRRILQGVRQAIHATGSLNVTIEQVAAEAGVGVATIYRHFGDKTSLMQAFSEELTPRREARELLDHPGPNLREDLIRFALGALSFIAEYHDLAGLLIRPDEQSEQLLGHLQSNQNRTLMRLKKYFAGQIEQGRLAPADPFDLATAFSGLVFGMTLIKTAYTRQPLGDPAALAPIIVDLFLDGAVADSPVDHPDQAAAPPAPTDETVS